MIFYKFLRCLAAIIFIVASFNNIVSAQIPDFPLNIKAQLVSETEKPKPGATFTIAITMSPDKGWHGYWENPGDAGQGLHLNWTLPKGVTAGKTKFPIPEKLIINDLMNFTYEGKHSFLIDFNISKDIELESRIPIELEASWLACTDRICVPEKDNLSINLVTGDGNITIKNQKKFGEYKAKLATPLFKKARYQIQGDDIAIAIPINANVATDNIYFFPAVSSLIDYQAPQNITRQNDMLILKTRLDPYREDTYSGKKTEFSDDLRGILSFGNHNGVEFTASKAPIEGAFDKGFAEGRSIGLLLLSAVLGGLILNLMPCVFPIIGLKAISLAKLSGDEKAAKNEALAYSIGVIISTMLLGATLLILRASGEQIGWAFQLQSPVMLLVLFILMLLITFNLIGLFELSSINIGQKLTASKGRVGSFWTGVLAAFVATPCTGPFMAAALGAALILPAYQAMMIFFGLGFGLALPYLAIAYIPYLRHIMPKPGQWMGMLQKIMAIPMGLTAAALFWLLYRVGGNIAVLIAMVSALITLMLVVYVRKQQKQNLKLKFLPILVAALAWFIGGYFINDAKPNPKNDIKKWVQTIDYDKKQLAKYRQQGKAIFLYFTADWCVTCKINEKTSIQREETAQYFEQNNIIVMEGDWTNKDPDIANILYQHGVAGVPLYLYYGPKKEAKTLPQILTIGSIKDNITL